MKKETFVTKEQLDEIVKKYPTPFQHTNYQRCSACMEKRSGSR